MKCPTCKTVDLVMSERHGIEIDYCPQCRGIWLDRGELDKIIERATAAPAAYTPPPPPQPAHQQPVYNNAPSHYPSSQAHPSQQHYPSHGDKHYYGHHKKRESFWGELFDFD